MITKVCLLLRVSSEKQDYKRQLFELNAFCQERNFKVVRTIASKISGTKTGADRPDLQELFQAANRGEFKKVVITEMSRLGRKSKDIRNTIDTLHQKKISIVFKNLGGLESLDYHGKETFVSNIIISIYAELAQEERTRLVENINSGLRNARRKGKILGRPLGKEDKTAILKKYPKLVAHLKQGRSLNECMRFHGLAKSTVIKVKKLI
jgi:DNA invertase Pin-like site-specific DNA recombinase